MKRVTWISIAAVLIPVSLLAHPGHGETDGFTIIHYLVEPIHAIATIGGILAAVVYLRWEKKKSKVRS